MKKNELISPELYSNHQHKTTSNLKLILKRQKAWIDISTSEDLQILKQFQNLLGSFPQSRGSGFSKENCGWRTKLPEGPLQPQRPTVEEQAP